MLELPFARPSFLALLAGLLVLGIVGIVAAKQRRRQLLTLGRPETVLSLSTLRPKTRRRSRLLLFAGLACLLLAVAGPRWGQGGNEGVVVGRDLVIIVDLSRSMTAKDMDGEQAERWQAAQAGVHDLIDRVRQRGGHRLALVVFAARPVVVCPLTPDYDHVRSRLDEFSPHAPPNAVRPDPDEPWRTGTAIGAAIHAALATHDTRFPGYQDILLVSDGDGPDVEQEVEFGIREAAERQIPVHTVGVGDAQQPAGLVLGGGDNPEYVGTKLQEGTLKDIARRTKGEYYGSGRDTPALGPWFSQTLEHRPSRELSDDALPQPRDRSAWFLVSALLLLMLAWVREP